MNQQTLQELLAERVAAYANSDRPRELIDEGIEKLFADVVKDTFRSYGDFGGAVKEAVKAALPANVSDVFELQRYNALVANVLRERWQAAALQSTVLEQADKAISEVLDGEGLITGEISLKGLIDEFIADHKDQAAEERWSRPEIRFEESEIASSTFLYIGFDPEPEQSRDRFMYSSDKRSIHSLKHSLHIHIQGERATEDRFRPTERFGDVVGAKLDEKKIAVNMRVRSKWERMLASLYFGNALLIIDCEEDEFDYGFDD
ncbi:hypothetical protein ACI2KG_00690 [Pseudomonas sp. NPDC089407]|uniref:hypothetical protein n=1 Tax=Pseudomonas sp. NPDC089407 TaxID=3364464 RepID=UPI00384EEBD7